MKLKIILTYLVTIFFVFYCKGNSQSYDFLNSNPMFNPAVSKSINESSHFDNPAALKGIERTALGVSASTAKFGIPELSRLSLFFASPVSNDFHFGTLIKSRGYNLFNSSQLTLCTSYSFKDFISLGASADLVYSRIKDFGSSFDVYFNSGALIQFSPYLSAGFVLKNISGKKDITDIETIRVFSSGFCIKPDTNLYVYGYYNLTISKFGNAGAEVYYSPIKSLGICLGAESNPAAIYAGFAFDISNSLNISFLFYYHNTLGLDAAPEILYHF